MTTAAPTIEERLDAIARRQTARFLDLQNKTGQSTTAIERDFKRSVRFIFDDVKSLLHGKCAEVPSELQPKD